MEAVIHLDTHVAVWLWAGERARLEPVRDELTGTELVISPIVELELQYLYEIGRIAQPGQRVVGDLVAQMGVRLSTAPLALVVASAVGMSWTKDPFDRLIAGNALAEGAPLLTRDESIRAHCPWARWSDA